MRNKRLIVLLSVIVVLVVAVVACGATFLVRKVEAYSYYGNGVNGTVDYDEKVIAASGIKKNSSIFFLDESAVKKRVESAFNNIGVVNVERKFPDRVSINYVVYENSFQYKSGDAYYQCYSSGRIGSTSAGAVNGYFTVKPKFETATTVGAYFQSVSGQDRKIIDAFIKFMYDKGLGDRQINERIDFVDLTRDGYVYIRTNAGCSIELRGGLNDFVKLMERGWAIFADPNPDSPAVSRVSGLISVWMYRGGNTSVVKSSYTAVGAEIGVNGQGKPIIYTDDSYYAERYLHLT